MDYRQSLRTLVEQYQEIEQKKLGSASQLLAGYRSSLIDLTQKYRTLKPVKPRPLTIPVIFGRTHDENFISDYLAYVLDPQKNGIGTGPLEALLDLCAKGRIDEPLDNAIIRREYPLMGGRLDLLIQIGDNLVIGIENKIFSPEGVNQTSNYADVMDELFSEIPHSMIFLTRMGHRAGSEKFKPVSYAVLLATLEKVSVAHVDDTRKLVLWKDFLEHLEVYIMTANADRFEFSEKAKLYLENRAMLHDLTTTFHREWDKALSYLETRFRQVATGGPWQTLFQTRYEWHQAYKANWATGSPNIHFEWWLPISSISSSQGELSFMVDVEGRKVNETLALFANRYPQIESQYKQKGIDRCPQNRKNAIAFKKYKISQDINQIADVIIASFEEFSFLESEIDTVLTLMSQK